MEKPSNKWDIPKGQIALVLMPRPSPSSANARVRPTTAVLNSYSKAMMSSVLEQQLARQFDQTQGPDHGRIVQDLIDKQKRNQP
ncbi:hypothetical protein ACQEPB_14575 [Novosphingobium fluoreni]|uniref:hypothetical protein n=1 Tax=Novosphingobium fluoreni TaxID=1391222 RepID=UPI003DA16E07